MSKKKNTGFELTFPENLKRDANFSTTRAVSFDDLGNFYEERLKIRRSLERNLETELRIDYSDFSNHVFFDSAISKFDIAQNRIYNKYPYNGTEEEIDAFVLTGSGYENYIFDSWPRYVGYVEFDGATQYISASDVVSKLSPGTSSIYVSSWINVDKTPGSIHPIMSVISSSGLVYNGWSLSCSIPNTGDDPEIDFTIFSGNISNAFTISSSYAGFTGTWNCVAAMYDASADLVSLYINDQIVVSSSVSFGPIEFLPSKFYVGFSTISSDYFSGSIDEVRVCHTASNLWHVKNYNRPVYAATRNTSSLSYNEDYLKLNYRFNESVVGDNSVDGVVVDYSKNGIHGVYLNYSSINSRTSGSVMLNDPGDPILYSFHSDVVSFSSSAIMSATLYDNNNNNLIFNMIPEGILTADADSEGLYQAFVLVMARFFDELKLYADQFDNLRITNYKEYDETPDLFLPYLMRYFGWKVSEHFSNSDASAFFYGEDVLSSGSLENSLIEIRNQFWRRTLNNLPYLLKTRGKRYNLDAYFNVLGINKENVIVKEYGYLPGGSIVDTRIHKEKVVSLLGIGTGSFGVLSSSFVKVDSLLNSTDFAPYTVEVLMQLPFASASYSSSLVQGSVWQFVDSGNNESFTLLWDRQSLAAIDASTARFILTSSDGQVFSSSDVEVCDGDFVNVAAGLNSDNLPFIEIRTIDNDEIDFSSSFVGSVALSGVFTGSDNIFDFIIGANTGTIFENETQGFFGEVRFWNRALSASELDDHALHFESIGVIDPNEEPHPLRGHWPLTEYVVADSNGVVNDIIDHSRNEYSATGREFPVDENPYQKFYLEYNYLSPSVDLKWTENKIRIRNKTEILFKDVAFDTNEVSLEFNLVDALNEDISKIFSTFNLINNIIGSPVNKYRDEYSDLESIRRKYFERLSDNINFTNFFNLFRWFDKKLSYSIKQLLPARVKFIGGEQVVESHFLERSKYGYKYPIFRTPQEVPEIEISSSYEFDGSKMQIIEDDDSIKSSYIKNLQEKFPLVTKLGDNYLSVPVSVRPSSMEIECDWSSTSPVTKYADGIDTPHTNEYNVLEINNVVGYGESVMTGSFFSSAFYVTNSGTMLFGGFESCEIYSVPFFPYDREVNDDWSAPADKHLEATNLLQQVFDNQSGVYLYEINQSLDDTVWAIGGYTPPGGSSVDLLVLSSSEDGRPGSWGAVLSFSAENNPWPPFIDPGDEAQVFGRKIIFSGTADDYTVFVSGRIVSSSAGTKDNAVFLISASMDDFYDWGYCFVTGGNPGIIPVVNNHVDVAMTTNQEEMYFSFTKYGVLPTTTFSYTQTFSSSDGGGIETWLVDSQLNLTNVVAGNGVGDGFFIVPDNSADGLWVFATQGNGNWYVLRRDTGDTLWSISYSERRCTTGIQKAGMTSMYVDENDIVYLAGFTGAFSGDDNPDYIEILYSDNYGFSWQKYVEFMEQDATDLRGIRKMIKRDGVLFSFINAKSVSDNGHLVFPFKRRISKFFPVKTSGDTNDYINDSNTSINFKNEFARKLMKIKDRDNE